ncbi:hypothetical protein FACS189472_05720 [Alphaproteobacteria bacterium]|nr:hypothetical protein FACS189472_05720 [Alphaproteobacteria bacterium]
MKNKTLCCVAALMLALSSVDSVYSVPMPTHADEIIPFDRFPSTMKLADKIEVFVKPYCSSATVGNGIAERIYDISAVVLADYAKNYLNTNNNISEERRKMLEASVNLIFEAHNLEACDPGSSERSNFANRFLKDYGYIFPYLFDLGELNINNGDKDLVRNGFYAMMENPSGAQRILSLWLLRQLGNDSPFAYKYVSPIQIKASNQSQFYSGCEYTSYVGRGVIKKSVHHPERHIELKLSSAKKTSCPSVGKHELISGTLMHELGHFYHWLLLGGMPGLHGTKDASKAEARKQMQWMTSEGNLLLHETLFPTQYINGEKDKFRNDIFNAIGNATIDVESLSELLESLLDPKEIAVLPMTEAENADYRRRIKEAGSNNSSLKVIAVDLITKIAFSANYWTDQEEILTIFGKAPAFINGERIMISDNCNESVFLKKSKLDFLRWNGPKTYLKDRITWEVHTAHHRPFSHDGIYFVQSTPQLDAFLKTLGIAKVYKENVNALQESMKKEVCERSGKGELCGNNYCVDDVTFFKPTYVSKTPPPEEHMASKAPPARIRRVGRATKAPLAGTPRGSRATGAQLVGMPRGGIATGAPLAGMPRETAAKSRPAGSEKAVGTSIKHKASKKTRGKRGMPPRIKTKARTKKPVRAKGRRKQYIRNNRKSSVGKRTTGQKIAIHS